MNTLYIDTLVNFAETTLQYLAEGREYELTALWQHLENERKLRQRLFQLYPVIEAIINIYKDR